MNKAVIRSVFVVLWLFGLQVQYLGAEDRVVTRILQQARAAIGTEADLNKLSSLQLVGQLTLHGADKPTARMVIIAQKPHYHRFELLYEHVVETTLCNGEQACILRAKLPDGRPQMRWLKPAQVEAILQNMHHLFYFYQANQQAGETVSYAGTTLRHQQSCHRIVYRYADGRQTVRYFNRVSGRLVSIVDWNGREAEVLDWAQVQGGYYPKKLAFSKHGKALHTVAYSQIVANNALEERLFAMPKMDKNN
jgi:hypothetical protein